MCVVPNRPPKLIATGVHTRSCRQTTADSRPKFASAFCSRKKKLFSFVVDRAAAKPHSVPEVTTQSARWAAATRSRLQRRTGEPSERDTWPRLRRYCFGRIAGRRRRGHARVCVCACVNVLLPPHPLSHLLPPR